MVGKAGVQAASLFVRMSAGQRMQTIGGSGKKVIGLTERRSLLSCRDSNLEMEPTDVVDLFIANGPGHVDNKFLVFLEVVSAVHKV